jgi:hypothetical protein
LSFLDEFEACAFERGAARGGQLSWLDSRDRDSSAAPELWMNEDGQIFRRRVRGFVLVDCARTGSGRDLALPMTDE